jgi:DNA-binding beta-propeller fold protein YncE
MAFDGTYVWVVNNNVPPSSVQRLAVANNGTALETFTLPTTSGARHPVYDSLGKNMWVFTADDPQVYKFDALSGKLMETVSFLAMSTSETGVFDGEFLWASGWSSALGSSVIEKISVATNQSVSWTKVDIDGAMAFDGRYVWIAQSQGLLKFDPQTNTVVWKDLNFQGPCGTKGISFDGTYLWATSYGTDNVYRIDPKTNVVTAIQIGCQSGARGVDSDGTNVWVVCVDDSTLIKVDPKTMQRVGQVAFPFEAGLHDTVFDGKFMWVSGTGNGANTQPSQLYKVQP